MEKVKDAYKTVENAVVGTYQAIEDTVVKGYTKIEDTFVATYLTHEGETVEQAKARLKAREK